MSERIHPYAEEIIGRVQLMAAIAIGATVVTALGLREWHAARREEQKAAEALKESGGDFTEKDAIYKVAYNRRQRIEGGLTLEEENQVKGTEL